MLFGALKREMIMSQAGIKEKPHHTKPSRMPSEVRERIDQRTFLTLRVNIIDPGVICL